MPQFSHAVARVAVWNLAGFNPRNPASGISTPSERFRMQAKGLAVLDAELVTLVEVSPVSYIDDLAQQINQEFGLDYVVKMIPQQNGSIHIGFLHKPGVEVENLRFIEGSQGQAPTGRKAVAADIKMGSFRAVVIGVHLKSGRGAQEQALRDPQCQAIGTFISQLRQTPGLKQRAVVLMGDFNMIPGQDVSNFHHLGGDDLMDFVSSWDLQDRFSHILPKGRANLLDGFAVTRTFTKQYIRGSLRLFPMHWTMDMGRAHFKDEVSDHLPFIASFRIS